MKVLIGVDPHKASVAVAAVDEAAGELLERASFPQNRAGLRSLERWAKRFPERRWAVENAGGLGRHLAGRLAAAGESVVDVPPKLSARVRVLSTRQRPQERRARCPRHRVGRLAQRAAGGGRSRGRLGGAAPAFREARGPGGRAHPGAQPPARAPAGPPPRRGSRDALGPPGRAHPARHTAPGGASARLRRRLASEVLRDVRTLDRKIADLNGRIEAEVEASGTTLTEIFGIGPILAAKIIGTVGNVARFPTKAHFASYSGTAPVEASSGEVVRHRLSLAGNRKLNYALHMVAVCQARSDARGGSLLPQEDRGGQIPQGGAAVPQEAHLRCRLQEPHGGFAGAFAQRRLTKRSREYVLPRLYEKWSSGGISLL